jgi:organic radical activating enzyme
MTVHDKLPLVESFYSLQGEGFYAGKPAWFIRLGGCNVGCKWCDSKSSWDALNFPLIHPADLVAQALQHPAKAVIVTGGEPLLHTLDLLCELLTANGFKTFLETSGTAPLSGTWDWICLSPKPQRPPLHHLLKKADELKVIIGNEKDLMWAEANAKQVARHCLLFLQPQWSARKTAIPLIVEYAKEHPQWNISLQLHKLIHIQ